MLAALKQMNQTGRSRLLVMQDGTLVGLITLKDLLDFISLKIELESGSSESGRRTKALT